MTFGERMAALIVEVGAAEPLDRALHLTTSACTDTDEAHEALVTDIGAQDSRGARRRCAQRRGGEDPVRAVSLHQPFASLIAVGAKQIETRSWRPPASVVGRRIAIHAALNRRSLAMRDWAWFSDALDELGELPLGAVIATVRVHSYAVMTQDSIAGVSRRERKFGDYQPGRFMWFLSDPRPLSTPVAFRGGQRIFMVPDELLAGEA